MPLHPPGQGAAHHLVRDLVEPAGVGVVDADDGEQADDAARGDADVGNTGFAIVASLYAGLLWFEIDGSWFVGGLTAALGIAGVTASGFIYRVPSRPAWNTPLTLVQFNLTALALGPLLAAVLGVGDRRWLAVAAATMAAIGIARSIVGVR